MSSTLDHMVPVLTGVNYLDWATRMSAYLEGKGLLGHALGKIPKPAIPQSSPALMIYPQRYLPSIIGLEMMDMSWGLSSLRLHFMCKSI